MELQRSSGILLHPTSLPGRFNVGDFGASARKFVDKLADAGQKWWQILPLTPPGYGGSPYGSTSSFSINLALIDPLWLLDNDWLTKKEIAYYEKKEPPQGDLLAIADAKRDLLDIAYDRFMDEVNESGPSITAGLDSFYEVNSWWLWDDALYDSLRKDKKGKSWKSWGKKLVKRDKNALAENARRLSEEISRYIFAQWIADMQWQELREYATAKGIKLIGDLPIFVAMDSSDVWAHREVFQVSEDGNASVVAGVPPDYFSKTGQKWGNPLYRWDDQFDAVMEWWIKRIERAKELVDLIRIDHFRAFADYWEVPADAPTAEHGQWRNGPGDKFFDKVRAELGDVPFIAEDLGIVSNEVYALRDRQHLPGMKVMEFAFDGNPEHPFLPHTFPQLCVAYPGTHDNNTIRGWMDEASDGELHNARVYLSSSNEDLPKKMMESLLESNANLVIFQLQDLFELPGSARMNTPGLADGNWTWRMSDDMLDPKNPASNSAWQWLKNATKDADR